MSFWDGKIVDLFHGTTLSRATSIVQQGPDITLSRASLDFGRGFYTTTRLRRAIQWAYNASNRFADPPAIVCWVVPYDVWDTWPKITFADAGPSASHFWTFVQQNRTLRRPHRTIGYFGIVVGPASSRWQSKLALADLDQVSFHTDQSLQLLTGYGPTAYQVHTQQT